MKYLKSSTAIIVASMLMLCFFASCEESVNSPTACSAVFKTHQLSVLTPNKKPADAVQISITSKETGNKIEPCKNKGLVSCDKSNPYLILHDGLSEKISREGEKIIVKGSKENLSFTEEFTFRFDGCHVRKVAGPDTVRLSR